MPIDVGADFQRAVHFAQVVHLDQDVELAGLRGVVERLELLVVQAGDDEQDGVRAGDDALEDLQFIDDEILAQQRQLDLVADEAQVGEVAVEIFLVGQDAERLGAAAGVFARLGERVEIGGDDAGGGRGLLHLGDDGHLGAAMQPGAEGAKVVAEERLLAQFGGMRLEPLDLGGLAGIDFG